MRRLAALAMLCALLPASPGDAQQPTRPVRMGVVGVMSADTEKAFDDALAAAGLIRGRDVFIDRAFLDGTGEQATTAIAELLRSQPDIVVVWGTVGAVAVKKAGPRVPVVFLSVGVPVEIGLVASLAHPGGNMTGVTFEAATETYPKRLQLLKEIVPGLSRIAVLFAAGDPNVDHALRSFDAAAPALGVRLQRVGVRTSGELDAAFATMRSQGAQGLVVVAGAFTFQNGRRIAELALGSRLPSSHAFRETVAAGGLVSLGPNYPDMAVQGVGYVVKVIKGARPADLPVEQPSKFDLAINLRTAKALGLAIPQSLLLRADQVID